jgi:sulfite reductase beta subunit-like hemoprotein
MAKRGSTVIRVCAAALALSRCVPCFVCSARRAAGRPATDAWDSGRGEESAVEPIYGKTYLPRKFKIVVAVPPSNDVDVFAHDLGFIAIADKNGGRIAARTAA